MKSLPAIALQRLCQGEPCALVTVVNQDGSAPRGAGSVMLVTQDGAVHGSIGGGVVEGQSTALALETLCTGKSLLQRFELNLPYSEGMDMICGGRMEVLCEPFLPTAENRALIQTLADPASARRRAFSLVLLETGSLEAPLHGRCLVLPSEGTEPQQVRGIWTPPSDLLDAIVPKVRRAQAPFLLEHHGALLLLEPLLLPATLYLCGGGHISLELAIMGERLGLRLVVLDDRPEYANTRRFPMAERVLVPPVLDGTGSLDTLLGETLDEDSHVILVTRGHQHDKSLLGQALRSQAGYIGMIGSLSKRAGVYHALRQEGFTDADLTRVSCPIGLDIGARTPAEIAVSILAEIIQVRAKRAKE
jgi:xanthine dehydrogenase accessory factor